MPLMQAMFQPPMSIEAIKADTDEREFRLRAKSGNFLANLFGMGSKSTITMDHMGFRINKSTFGSDETTYIPRSHIASTVHVVAKPMEYLILGLLLLIVLVGIIFLLMFLFSSRRVIVGVISTGGTVEALKLKVSPKQIEQIKEGMAIMEAIVQEGVKSSNSSPAPQRPTEEPRRPQATASSSSSASALTFAEPTGTLQVNCPGCGTRLNVPVAMAGRKVRCSSCREIIQVPS